MNKDFQIIKSASLTFQPGLNAIIGQSNNGKTALFRAAKACIYNEPGTTSVRNGCSQYAVGIQMNGHTVICQKGQSNVYKIDGKLFQKIGRTQLPEVAGALGIRELNLNGSNEQLNFWDQMEKPFLLDRSETELFRFIVDSGKDNNVTTALKTITQDRQQITKDITLTEGKIRAIEDNIARQEEELKDSDKKLEVYSRVIELGPKIKRVQDLTNLKSKSLLDGQNLSAALTTRGTIDAILSKVETKLEVIKQSSRKLELLGNLQTKIGSTQSSIDSLQETLNKISHLEVPDLNEKLNKYKLLSELISKSRSTSDLISELSSKQFPTLSEDFGQKAQKYTDLGTIISNITYKQEQIKSLEDTKKQVEEELKKVNKEIDEVGICPTCGQPIHNS